MIMLIRMWAIFVIAVKRLLSQRGLALATTVGLITAVALTLSVPLYADAVYDRVLREELLGIAPGVGASATRLPLAFTFRYMAAGGSSTPLEWEDIQPIDAYLSGPAQPALGLPPLLFVRYFKTDAFRLFPQEDAAYADSTEPLAAVSFAFVSDLEDHINLLEGSFPAVAASAPDSTVEVLISEPLALELGLQVGEEFIAFALRGQNAQIPVRVTGVWRATDPQEAFWFSRPKAFETQLLVPEETYLGRISPYLDEEVHVAVWHLVMDGSNVRTSNATPLLFRINAVRQQAAALLPNTTLVSSPADALQRYQAAARLLTVLLYAFSVPIIGLTLAFIGLAVGLTVARQRNEIAVLRSRGATAIQVVGIAALEGLLLSALALAIGLPTSKLFVRLIGQARSFLDFSAQSDLRVVLTTATVRFSVVAVVLVLLAQVVPTLGAARYTIVTYKHERARTLQRPWWQRAWLDVLLLIPAAYGAFLLRQQGSISLPVADGMMVGDPFQNPLLFLVPALGIFAITLFLLRLLPIVMGGLAWLVAHTRSVGLLLAARYLARTPGLYAAPLVLLVLTLSLSAFTASLAQTLDSHLFDQMYYRVGADMRFPASGELTPAGEGDQQEAVWLFLPTSEYLKVPDVQAATRVGRYVATSELSGRTQTGAFIGINRLGFPQVAFWRQDFAPDSLGALMNAMALALDGVLLPRSFMRQHAVEVGDIIRVRVETFGERVDLDMRIVGGFDLFPTWYPQEGPLFVGHLDYLFQNAGGQVPYDVWLKTAPNVDYDQIEAGVQGVNVRVQEWVAPQLDIAAEQLRPERQGLFGVLSVGFAAAALLTVLGFLLYTLFSFRRRFIELGTLRAIGLSSGHMAGFLVWELAFLILTGLAVGTGLGAWVSVAFIPFLQVGAEPSARIPPFQVQIAWPAIFRIYGLFGVLFVIALGVLIVLLLRMRIFQALKLGETV